MPKNHELDTLKTREQNVFQLKQVAWNRYTEAKNRCSELHNTMQEAWRERCLLREEMNREYDNITDSNTHYHNVWDEYSRIRDRNNSRIESLRNEADYEHQAMIRCFNQASFEYSSGNKSMAPVHSREGHQHKECRDNLNREISYLAQEVKSAKQDAIYKAPKTNSALFKKAKEAFLYAKSKHESIQSEFKQQKSERDRFKAEFDALQKEHTCLKEEFKTKLEKIKIDHQRERDKTLDKANMHWSERSDAKIVKKADGTTQVYHGGLGKGDGLGHGHTTLDQFGKKTYDRGAFEEHGHQNYTDDGKGFTMYNRRVRTSIEIGGLGKENYIDVRTGVGHTTQWYKDGYRVSWDTKDGGQTEKAHWTNQNLPYGHPDRHKRPDDTDV